MIFVQTLTPTKAFENKFDYPDTEARESCLTCGLTPYVFSIWGHGGQKSDRLFWVTFGMDHKIERATPADVPILNKLVNSAYRGESSRKGWATEADLIDGTRIDEAAMLDLINDKNTTVLKYTEDGAILGCVELRKENDSLYLGMLTVNPDLQSRGIGKKLMATAEEFARQQRCKKIRMTVVSVRDKLIAWYVRYGYSLTGERKPFKMPDERWGIPKQPLEFVVMEKVL